MDRIYASGAAAAPPSYPVSPSVGFPALANPGLGVPATVVGDWWPHMITEEIRNAIVASGITPAGNAVNQLSLAIQAMVTNGVPLATESLAGKAEIATTAEILAGIDDARFTTALKLKQLRDSQMLGWGQEWVDVKASRASNTPYLNNTGHPIFVSVQAGPAGSVTISVSPDGSTGWVVAASDSSGAAGGVGASCGAIIQDGKYYRAVFSGSIVTWSELRN